MPFFFVFFFVLFFCFLFLGFESTGTVSTKTKRDDFDLDVVNFPFLDGVVPGRTSYCVYIFQLIRFARASSNVTRLQLSEQSPNIQAPSVRMSLS